jgi:hypothetical protein
MLGGKAGWSPASVSVIETVESIRPKSLAPLAHRLALRSDLLSDFLIGEAVGGQQDHAGSLHSAVLRPQRPRAPGQSDAIIGTERDRERASVGHAKNVSASSRKSVNELPGLGT